MIPKECKRLAEVDFPIALVSKHSTREKKIFGYHPQMLNQWWARRPLATCRAMLLGLLLPDPCDPRCPEDFKGKARELLPKVQGKVGTKDKDLQQSILKFIGDFSNWDLSTNQAYLEVSRGLLKAAHNEEIPLVVDPFAGGGSIPLEALRLGCETFASDLNPVACLILKVMLEDIPRHGSQLNEMLGRVGKKVREEVEKQLAEFYPHDPDGSKPIAYLWGRTVRCETPKCGAEIPIYRSPWLSKKGIRRARYFQEAKDGDCVTLIVERALLGSPITFRIARGHGSQDPRPGFVSLSGTKASGNNANAECPCCGTILSGARKNPRTSSQLAAQHGGSDVIFDNFGKRIGGARILAVVTLKPNGQGRNYRLATEDDYAAVWKATKRLEGLVLKPLANGLSPVPDEPLPPIGTLGFRIQRYGMLKWSDLFTARQKLALITLASSLRSNIPDNPAMLESLAFLNTRLADKNATLVSWDSGRQTIGHVFSRQALPIVWDFVESSFPSNSDNLLKNALNILMGVVENCWKATKSNVGQVHLLDACKTNLPHDTADIWFTDPPYYDAVPYADLSDFFFVWLKRVLLNHALIRDPFDPGNPLTPKVQEIVQDEIKQIDGQPKNSAFFEKMMGKAFSEGRRILKEDGIGCVVFAHKTTEGWEALLTGMIHGGWTITGSWPIATERPGRLRSQESAALATSVHLVCRPRSDNAPVGDWGKVLRELPNRVGDWMERLQSEGIRGADLVFACIGPALEIFSRYSKVVDAEEREIPLGGDPEAKEPHRKGFLAYVWEVVGRTALEHVLGTAEAKARNSTAGALEEDARLTALFLWTLQSTNGSGKNGSIGVSPVEGDEEEDEEDEEEKDTGRDAGATKKKKGYSLVFDVVRRFAQPLGIHLPEWEGRIIETEKGIVRLLSVKERAKQLFGEESAQTFADRFERSPEISLQLKLFPERDKGAAPEIKGHKGRKKKAVGAVSDEALKTRTEATTLDRIHAAMLLQASGRTNALRALLKAEQDRGPDFLRLANALSALYPKQSEEKRLLDAMLLAIPR